MEGVPKPKGKGKKGVTSAPKKTPQDVFSIEELIQIESNMNVKVCILCGDLHGEKNGKQGAWLCPKALLTGPMSPQSWVGQTFDKSRLPFARTYIAQLQKAGILPDRGVLPATDTPAALEAETDEEGGRAQAPATGSAPASTITEAEKAQAVAEVKARIAALENDKDQVLCQYPMQHGSCRAIEDARKTEMTTNFYKIDIGRSDDEDVKF